MYWLRLMEALSILLARHGYARAESGIGTSSFPYRACVVA